MSPGGHYVNFVYCDFMNCLMPSIEHRQSKSSSSMPSSWTMNLTARGGRSFRVGATPRAEICCRCASIHRRSSSVLMPAARAIWSLLFTFIVGESFNAAKIRLFFLQNNIYIYIYCGEKTQRNPTKSNETQRNLLIPTYSHGNPRKPTALGLGCRTFAVRLGFDRGLWSGSPLDRPWMSLIGLRRIVVLARGITGCDCVMVFV